MTRKVLAAGLLLVALTGGCSKPADKFVGKWDGELVFPSALKDLGVAGAKEGGVAYPRPDEPSVSWLLELKPDATYELAGTYKGISETQKGTWSYTEDSKKITLKPAQDQSTQSQTSQVEALEFEVSDDGRIIESSGTNELKAFIRFAKQ